MAEFKYTLLPKEEQVAVIESRLVALERDHFNVSLDVVAQGEAANPALEARLDELAATIEDLRARVKSLA